MTEAALSSKRRTLRGLDAVNFLMADLETGVGPFLAIFLVSARHWEASRIGLVVAVQSLVTVVLQTPIGALVDWSRHKKWLLVGGTLLISFACYNVVRSDKILLQVLDQMLIGIAAATFIPAIASVSLGVVGSARLPRRIGRNEAMNHAGNVTFALTAAWVGAHLGQASIFTAAAMFSFVTAIAGTVLIRSRDIDDAEARGATHDAAGGSAEGAPACRVRDLLRQRRVQVFVALAFLYHLANGAMLPLVGEMLAKGRGVPSSYMSACIVVAQLTMVPVVLIVSRLAARGRKTPFVCAYLVLALRGVCYLFSDSPWYFVSLQVLDAVGAGIFGALWPVVTSDLAHGTGRFNFLQGVVQAAVGLGIFISNVTAGYAVRAFGFHGTFLLLAGVALCGFSLFTLAMPETAPGVQASRGRSVDDPSPRAREPLPS